jgi:methylaspartate ammonia-lyase
VTLVKRVLLVPARTGFFTDDQAAILAGAAPDGAYYPGTPRTTGFTRIRQPGEAVSVLLVLDDGYVAHGDCAAVQYSGAGGRDPVFLAEDAVATITRHVTPWLTGLTVDCFRDAARGLDAVTADASPLHTAVRYGISQALLDATAHHRRVTMAEVIRDEWDTGVDLVPIPMFAQSGDDRRAAVDRMVLKGAGVLPHGLINSVETKLGRHGEVLAEYVRWTRDRVLALRPDESYRPVLHFDVYGTVGEAFGSDVHRVADYLTKLGELASPFALQVEQPMDAGSTPGQVAAMSALRAALHARGSEVKLVVDEWCNTLTDVRLFVDSHAVDMVHVKMPDLGSVADTVQALLHVRAGGLLAYCGGTCNETDRSAQVSAHVAMACGAAQVLAKPGMGVDEGLMIVGNEMARTAALAGSRLG